MTKGRQATLSSLRHWRGIGGAFVIPIFSSFADSAAGHSRAFRFQEMWPGVDGCFARSRKRKSPAAAEFQSVRKISRKSSVDFTKLYVVARGRKTGEGVAVRGEGKE